MAYLSTNDHRIPMKCVFSYLCIMNQPDTHFFLPHLQPGLQILDHEESLHAVKVCRAATGDRLLLCDGQGHFASGTVVSARPEACSVQIESVALSDRPLPRLHLALACLKDDDMEEVVFHCTQLDVASITLLRTEHSLEPRKSNLERTLRRCRAKSLVSLKQSRKAWLTAIEGPVYLSEWLSQADGELLVCDPRGVVQAPQGYTHFARATLLVGPEGGLSSGELTLLTDWRSGAHTHLLGLGANRLRAVTAPLFALGVLGAS